MYNTLYRHTSTTTTAIARTATMARTKNISNPNNMLWVLASLACDKTSDSQSSSTLNVVQQRGSMSDERDDQTRRKEDDDSGPPKEIVVARRACMKPIKKRSLKVMKNDYQVHTVDVTGPRKKNKPILPYKIQPLSTNNHRMPTATRIDDDYNEEEASTRNNEYVTNKENTSASAALDTNNRVEVDLTVDDEDDDVSVLVCISSSSSKGDGIEQQWEKDHSPLQLPSYLPCPGVALRYVQSISLKIQEREKGL